MNYLNIIDDKDSMNAKGETVHIIFLSNPNYFGRIRYLLRRLPPQKVYFIKSKEQHGMEKNGAGGKTLPDFREKVKEKLAENLPKWVYKNSKEIEISFFDFSEAFSKILRIMISEKRKGNEVNVILHGTTTMVNIAAAIAANLSGSKALYAIPENWTYIENKGHNYMIASGAKDFYEINVPFVPSLPKKSESLLLIYLLEKGGSVDSKLSKVAMEIGLENLGKSIKKPTSASVILSKIISKLRENGLIETERISRKIFKISLTERGKFMAETVSIMGVEQCIKN